MTHNNPRRLFFGLLLLACFSFVFFTDVSLAGTYQPCNVPPVVGSATRPNVLIVMDFSGSMQFPAYFAEAFDGYYGNYVADCYRDNVYKDYNPNYTYYGTFEPDKYYVYNSSLPTETTTEYFQLASTQPVTSYTFTAESQDGGSNSIWFTAAGHTFQVGDLVAVYDLTSHKSLSTNAYPVTEVSGAKFKIAQKWNGKADKAAGYAVKRVYGSLIPDSGGNVPGVSGNVLNFAITSRTDAALKALIGGRAVCDSDYCYLRPHGARKRVQDNTTLQTDMYVRPATLESSATYPDDYNSAGGYYKTTSGYDRDMFISIKGKYSGQLAATSPVYFSKYFEQWTFTLTKRTKIEMTLDGEWVDVDYLSIYTAPLAHNGENNSQRIVYNQANPASISTELDAGTYYVRATYQTNGLDAAHQKPYVIYSNVNLKPYILSGFTHNGVVDTKIGAIPWARARVRLEPDAATAKKDTRNGVIQRSWGTVRFGFMFYKAQSKETEGKMLIGCENEDKDKLINALEGVDNWASDGLDFTQVYPYEGTPTGEAMLEAYDYFNQHSNSDNADNSKFLDPGKLVDPFYGGTAGSEKPVPCRKSFVLLLSDGVWNAGQDPVKGAHAIHVGDLRPDANNPALVGDQNGEVYSILAFSQDIQGYNSMKAVAMYGGFGDVGGCGTTNFPFPKSGFPADSKNMTWPVPECNPSGTYDTTCCAEWDKIWDRDEDGTSEQKGMPDNYFQANDGKQLEDALLAVMEAVSSRTAAASAVATVSQEVRASDIIVRGVFEAADPDIVDKFLWKGHLEAYLPFPENNETVYDFETDAFRNAVPPMALCADIPESKQNCWDSGVILRDEISPAQRRIFTWDPVAKAQKDFDTVTRLDLGLPTDAERNTLVEWVKGKYDSTSPLRDRGGSLGKEWKLGDIVYSTPVVVGPPRLGDVSKRDPNVKQFLVHRDVLATRSKVVYVGANDGMLHAFLMGKTDDGLTWEHDHKVDPEIGKELWAYIPSNLLTELNELAKPTYGTTGCKHRSMVDLSSRAWEVYIKSDRCGTKGDAQSRCWRTVIVGGERGGGDVYFGIDITDPMPSSDPTKGPKVLWEYSVLKNRVVVEVESGNTNQSCVQACRLACTSAYTTCYDSCRAESPRPSKSACKARCTPAKTDCENNCVTQCTAAGGWKAYVPFRSIYDDDRMKILPMTWSQPYLGRIRVPNSVKFYVGDPTWDDAIHPENGGQPGTLMTFDDDNNKREVVFMGGGIHIYDKDFTAAGVDPRFKLALFWPFLLMMDIETGNNLFEYVWPVVLNYNVNNFPVKTAGANTIPYAMSDPVGLDVWDQNTDALGDDGYIDRVYVGDMNGYFYGLKFNFDEKFPDATTSNSTFGMRVDIWPTKPISNQDESTNDYRSELEPITVSPAVSFETDVEVPALRIIFGTGKYDDIVGGEDDKTDTTRMSLYNLRDPVVETISGVNYGLPKIDTNLAKEVYDGSHKTNFWVQMNPKCGLPTINSINFLDNCNWMKSTTDPDCCQSSCSDPCYACIYDFRHPCIAGSNGCLFPVGDSNIDTKPGERVIGKPLIAGGKVFVTTYVPPFDACGYTGQGYLYAFDYMCRPMAVSPFTQGSTAVPPVVVTDGSAGFVLKPESGGIPSRAVIDSRGENVIIQMSDGTLERHKVDLGGDRPVQFKGWRQR